MAYKDMMDVTLKIFQIAFYITGGTIAILTYLSVKRSLFNTANKEYHKKVINKIEALSQELFSEFDPIAENYWAIESLNDERLKKIQEKFNEHKTSIIEKGRFGILGGIPVSTNYQRLTSLVNKIKSDPFIPKKVRDCVIAHLEKRANTVASIYKVEIRKYMDELAHGKLGIDYEIERDVVNNRIREKLREENCDIDQVENQIHQIRLFIQEYLESFSLSGTYK